MTKSVAFLSLASALAVAASAASAQTANCTWYAETAPGLQKPLGLEGDVGITYDTSDRFHIGLTYAVLLPFGGLKNPAHTQILPGTTTPVPVAQQDPGVAHAIRAIFAIPF